MALPLTSHPIYHLRKISIVVAVMGILLCGVSIPSYNAEALGTSIFFLIVSALFCAVDVVCYATKKAEDPDEDPKWPLRKWMLGDFIFAVALLFLFFGALNSLSWVGYGYAPNIIGAYGALADLLCSVLHAWAFWKQLMARYKKKWLASLPKQQCARCGYSDDQGEPTTPQESSPHPAPNVFTYVGPSATAFRDASVVTPESTDSAMEEGLLIGSDSGSGYGSTERAEPTIEQPEEVVVEKGKKKKAGGKGIGKRPQA